MGSQGSQQFRAAFARIRRVSAEVRPFASLAPICDQAKAGRQSDEARVLPQVARDGREQEFRLQALVSIESTICDVHRLLRFAKRSKHHDLRLARDSTLVGRFPDFRNGRGDRLR